MQGIQDEVQRTLTQANRKRLATYAGRLLRGRARSLQQDVEDLVGEAVCRVIGESRKWNQEKTPELMNLFFSTMRSIVSKMPDKASRDLRSQHTPEEEEAFGHATPLRPDWEEGIVVKDFVEELYMELDGDEELTAIFEMIVIDGHSAAEAAERLGSSIPAVRAARKRLDRKIAALKKNKVTCNP